MIRRKISPRADWQQKVEEVGLTFHTINGETYWDESACYELGAAEIDALEAAANECNSRCLDAAQVIIDRGLWERFAIPEPAIAEIKDSWKRDDFTLYGRFDFAWDGSGPPKLLEYNADTPTALLEASVVQWSWLQEHDAHADQFNSLHERLIERWKQLDTPRVHFACSEDYPEDSQTLLYLRDTCQQSGKETVQMDMSAIGWSERARRFVDGENGFIEKVFKLYPWEWLWAEEFASHLPGRTQRFIEPVWKMLWSNKAILPVLWEMFPNHPNLLPCFESPESLQGNYVCKPKLSREGANIVIVQNGSRVEESSGEYGAEGFVYQAPAPMPCYEGNWPVFGVWTVGGEAAGLGIREDKHRITTNASRFVPHLFR